MLWGIDTTLRELQDHHCLVRGGADNGQKLMDALLVSSK
jgi:hypothetical protein